MSLPLPGAWIEMPQSAFYRFYKHRSLPLPGAWIEIYIREAVLQTERGRSLYRERGLK